MKGKGLVCLQEMSLCAHFVLLVFVSAYPPPSSCISGIEQFNQHGLLAVLVARRYACVRKMRRRQGEGAHKFLKVFLPLQCSPINMCDTPLPEVDTAASNKMEYAVEINHK